MAGASWRHFVFCMRMYLHLAYNHCRTRQRLSLTPPIAVLVSTTVVITTTIPVTIMVTIAISIPISVTISITVTVTIPVTVTINVSRSPFPRRGPTSVTEPLLPKLTKRCIRLVIKRRRDTEQSRDLQDGDGSRTSDYASYRQGQ